MCTRPSAFAPILVNNFRIRHIHTKSRRNGNAHGPPLCAVQLHAAPISLARQQRLGAPPAPPPGAAATARSAMYRRWRWRCRGALLIINGTFGASQYWPATRRAYHQELRRSGRSQDREGHSAARCSTRVMRYPLSGHSSSDWSVHGLAVTWNWSVNLFPSRRGRAAPQRAARRYTRVTYWRHLDCWVRAGGARPPCIPFRSHTFGASLLDCWVRAGAARVP
jgi:hypothetical protein